jgi:4-diphosphocytidyl-2-C-methyl-D-erythritol kinase
MTSQLATLHAQAKINLFLRVLAREAGGYHQIETLFCRIALGDTVRFRATEAMTSLDVAGPALPVEGLGEVERNLAWRAAALYRQETGWPRGFAIEIEKRIPVGAGLGGGSADAGAVLRCANALAPRPVSEAELLRLAGTLGADIPFLTQDRSPFALAWGRGDRLMVLPPPPSVGCVVLVPDFRISTAEAYGWLAASPEPSPAPRTYKSGEFGTWDRIAAHGYNAFERVVFERYPEYAATLVDFRRADSPFAVSLMTGSGSAAFAIMTSPWSNLSVTPAHASAWSAEVTQTSTEVDAVEVSA